MTLLGKSVKYNDINNNYYTTLSYTYAACHRLILITIIEVYSQGFFPQKGKFGFEQWSLRQSSGALSIIEFGLGWTQQDITSTTQR